MGFLEFLLLGVNWTCWIFRFLDLFILLNLGCVSHCFTNVLFCVSLCPCMCLHVYISVYLMWISVNAAVLSTMGLCVHLCTPLCLPWHACVCLCLCVCVSLSPSLSPNLFRDLQMKVVICFVVFYKSFRICSFFFFVLLLTVDSFSCLIFMSVYYPSASLYLLLNPSWKIFISVNVLFSSRIYIWFIFIILILFTDTFCSYIIF